MRRPKSQRPWWLKPIPDNIPYKSFSISELIKRPTHFARYGDGNFLVLEEADFPNCDGHRHDLPGLKEDVEKTLLKPKDLIYGLTPFAYERCKPTVDKYDIPWRDGEIWAIDYITKHGRGLDQFLMFLKKHNTFVVGPSHFKKSLRRFGRVKRHFITNRENCYLQKEEVLRAILSSKDDFDVCIFAAAMLSCVAIYELHEQFPGKWLIDVGAALDPMCGIHSRGYHKGGKRCSRRKRSSRSR